MADLTHFVTPDGEARALGNVMPTGPARMKAMTYGDRVGQPLYPRDQWPELIARMMGSGPFGWAFRTPVRDQNGKGQCNACAVATALESARMQQGLPHVDLSAGDLYDQINGGRDQGSTLEDGLAAARDNGIGTLATCGNYVWRGQNFRTAPAAERARFRVMEWALAPTFDHFMSGLIAGRPGVSGIWWYDNFTPDQDGWLPRPRGNRGGHATCVLKPNMRKGANGQPEFGLSGPNSWSKSFGKEGWFTIPEWAYPNNAEIGGWWLLVEAADEGGVVPEERP